MATSDDKVSRTWWRQQFRRQAGHPFAWEVAAAQLEYAAEVLLARQRTDVIKYRGKKTGPPFLFATITMLYGLAIEGLLKAILASRSSPLDAKGRISFRSHDLLDLARKVGLRTSTKDAHLLRKLSAFVTWAGKYPVPLSEHGMQPVRWPAGGFGPIHGSMGGNDFEEARRIMSRLVRSLPGEHARSGLRRFARGRRSALTSR